MSVRPSPGRSAVTTVLLMESPSMERWLRKRMDTTRVTYLYWFRLFLRFALVEVGVDGPDGFLAWAKRQTDNLTIGDLVEKWGESVTPGSRALAMAVPRSFLKRNGYTNLPMMDEWPVALADHPGYERKEVQQLLSFLDDKLQKLYVLFAKDSGLRARHLLGVQYWQIRRDLDAGLDYVHVEFEPTYRARRKAVGITFIGPNTLTLLRELIKEHRVSTEPASRIFRWDYNSISTALRLAKRKSGIEAKTQTSHGFRKFFTDSLDKVRMDHHKKLQLEGHSLGVRAVYTRQNVDELRKLYQQAYRFLDLSEEAVVDAHVTELRERLDSAEKQIGKLKEIERNYDFLVQRLGRIEALGPIVLRPEGTVKRAEDR